MTDPRDKRDGDPPGPGRRGVLRGVGLRRRRPHPAAHVFVVYLLSQLVSFALLLVVVALWADAVSWPGVGWGAAAGLVGTSLLYQGLAIGRTSVVAPITGVLGAQAAGAVRPGRGERPGPAALAGIVLGLVAAVVITPRPRRTGGPRPTGGAPRRPQDPPAGASSRQALCAFGGGLGFGLFYILLERSPLDSGLWPLLGTRVSLGGVLGLPVAARRLPVRPPAGMGSSLVGLEVINTAADLLFLLATRRGWWRWSPRCTRP
jgi:hypothetical protein